MQFYTGYNEFISLIESNFYNQDFSNLNTGIIDNPSDLTSGYFNFNISGEYPESHLFINSDGISGNYLTTETIGTDLIINVPLSNIQAIGALFSLSNSNKEYVTGHIVFNVNDTHFYTGLIPEDLFGDEDEGLLEDENGDNLGSVIPIFYGIYGENITSFKIINNTNFVGLDNLILGTSVSINIPKININLINRNHSNISNFQVNILTSNFNATILNNKNSVIMLNQ